MEKYKTEKEQFEADKRDLKNRMTKSGKVSKFFVDWGEVTSTLGVERKKEV